MVMLAALAVLAASCSPSDAEREQPVVRVQTIRPEIPPFAATACNAPVTIPDRDISEQEVASGWGADRASLRSCELRRSTAVQAARGPG